MNESDQWTMTEERSAVGQGLQDPVALAEFER